MLISAMFFAVMNIFVKLVPHIPAQEIVFFRALITLIMSYVFLKKNNIPFSGTNRPILLLRALFGMIGLILYIYSVQRMPLATAVTIHHLAPIFTTIFAIYILKEKVKPLQWLFFGIAFAGVAVIKGFDSSFDLKLFAMILGSALFAGLAYNMIRKLRTTDHPMVVVFYFPLITLPIITPFIFASWYSPIGVEWLYIFGIGICTQFAQYYMTKAYQSERIATVSMFKYSSVIYAILIGFLIFGETLNWLTAAGMALVVVGVLANLWYKRHLRLSLEREREANLIAMNLD
ncbi:MAG: drug/metabolite transporter (DMT)-like permease [Sphingobacteriales bacterium]|jgi:drug/metabolite transporter (DMT)-like permease